MFPQGKEDCKPYRNTAIDNFNTTSNFLDPGFKGHEVMAQIVAELVLQLASHTRLPLDPRELAHTLTEAYDEIHPLVTKQGTTQETQDKFGENEILGFVFGCTQGSQMS